ncbi:hypothetical protein [Nocardia heshunensis]
MTQIPLGKRAAVVVTVPLARYASGGFEWTLAVEYLPSIDTLHMRRWLERHRIGALSCTPGFVIPASRWKSSDRVPHRELCVPRAEYAQFVTAIATLPTP